MKTRPKYFLIYAGFLLAIALSFPIQALMITGHNPVHLIRGLLLLTPINMVVLGLCVATAVAAFRASPKLKLLIPSLLLATILNNYLVMKTAIGFNPEHVAWATAAFASFHLPLMFGSSKIVLLNPRSRWWLIPQRKLIDVPVAVKTLNGMRFTTRSFDLSENGAFLKIDPEVYRSGDRSFMKTLFSGARMNLKMSVGRFREIQCTAEVVRCQDDRKGQYPSGVGIRFLDLDSKTKNYILDVLKSHHTQPSYLRL